MARESHETPYGTCWSLKTLSELNDVCKEVISEIGKNELTDYDESALTKPYAMTAWKYIIKQVNNLIVCGKDHGLTPVFEVIPDVEPPHIWTIGEMHNILMQICPEIMGKYKPTKDAQGGEPPTMWHRPWLEKVVEVLRNGWCKIKENVVPCDDEPPPSDEPPKPYKIAYNVIVNGSVSESSLFGGHCYHYHGSSAPILWTSDSGSMTLDMYTGPNVAPGGYGGHLCTNPRCTNGITGSVTISLNPSFDPVTGLGDGMSFVSRISGPNGTYTNNTPSIIYPSYHCSGFYTAMGGYVNVVTSQALVYQ